MEKFGEYSVDTVSPTEEAHERRVATLRQRAAASLMDMPIRSSVVRSAIIGHEDVMMSENHLRAAVLDSIVRSYQAQPNGAEDNLLTKLESGTVQERERISGALTDIARHHDALMALQKSCDSAGISHVSARTLLHASYDINAIAYLITQYDWRYVPMMNDSDAFAMWYAFHYERDADGSIGSQCSEGDVFDLLDVDGCTEAAVRQIIKVSSAQAQQAVLNGLHYITLQNQEQLRLIDLHTDALRVHALAASCTEGQGIQARWDFMYVGTCSDMERTLKCVLGDSFSGKYHGRGFLVTQGGVPLGVIKAKGEASFIAARTVCDDQGDVLLLRGMAYVIGGNRADSMAHFGRALKNAAVLPQKRFSSLRGVVPGAVGAVPARSIDLDVVAQCAGSDDPVLFFKPQRIVQEAQIFKHLHRLIARAEEATPEQVALQHIQEALRNIAGGED